mmetsp:Transcript_37554/g.101818  ORF Transcript_37554/g.101818 Transcript_37554/m.101818 type:complete len:1270 (+) Transcript_37554:110-3919(+)
MSIAPDSGGENGWPNAKQLEKLMSEKEQAQMDTLGGSVEGIAAKLDSNCADGLRSNDADIKKRMAHFGENFFDEKELTTYLELIIEGAKDPTVIMLIICALVSAVTEFVEPPGGCGAHEDDHADHDHSPSMAPTVGSRRLFDGGDEGFFDSLYADFFYEPNHGRRLSGCGKSVYLKIVEPLAITLTVALVLNIAAYIDYSKERLFETLSKELEGSNKKFVIRDGKPTEVTDADIVVGDVMQFNAHMLASIPADGIFISGDNVKIDESALTGEPEPMEKTREAPYILSGTEVKSGSGTMLVVAVGKLSTSGKIKAKVYGGEVEDEQSPLFKKLDTMAMQIGKLGGVVAVICFVINCIVGFGMGNVEKGGEFAAVVEYCMTAITVLVVAIPEGLPLAVTLALAFSSFKMMDQMNLVKHLDACETMGSATTICSDKTGTLTANRMTVKGAWVGGHKFPPGPDVIGLAIKKAVDTGVVELLASLICVDTMNETFLVKNAMATGGADFKGNPTECALIVLARDLGFDYELIRSSTTGRSKETETQGKAFMFSSARKMMSWAVPNPEGGFRIFTKGASEVVLDRCTVVVDKAGATPFQQELKDYITTEVISDFASQAMRTIALAYKDIPPAAQCYTFEGTTSQYNESYVCAISAATVQGPNVSLQIRITGNGSLGAIQGQTDSKLAYDGTPCRFESSVSGTATSNEWAGELKYVANTDVTDPKKLSFQYGSGGYSTVDLPQPKTKTITVPDWEGTSKTVLNADGSPALEVECELTLIGVVGIEDPLRQEVPPAINTCYKAGIDVRMVTGDNLETAIAIASRCGILRPEHFEGDFTNTKLRQIKVDRAMEGKEFRRRVYATQSDGNEVFNQAEFDKIWPHLRVLARSSPEDKLTLADGLNKSLLCNNKDECAKLKTEGIDVFPDRQVVAMTGDGTNDAPALKRADVGFAMGISGTQIAKDAADIILMDDNFASIVTAANWGRNVFDSISKFLQFQLTVNIAALACTVVGAVTGRVPITPVQMLWINLIMDSLASVALASEPPNVSQMLRPPVNRSTSIITPRMWYFMLGHAIYQIAVIVGMMTSPGVAGSYISEADRVADMASEEPHGWTKEDVNKPMQGADWESIDEYDGFVSQHYTVIFNTFVLMTVFNQINSRMLFGELNVFEGALSNKYFVVIWIIEFVAQLCMAAVGGVFFGCSDDGLTSEQWIRCIIFALGVLPWNVVVNMAARMTLGEDSSKEAGISRMVSRSHGLSGRTSSANDSIRKQSIRAYKEGV